MGRSLNYMICATPRTGSYLLCEGLTHTGIAGRPTEFLSGPFERYWRPRWQVDTYGEYLDHVRRTGTTDNGVFGVKVHPVQLDHFCRRMGADAFTAPDAKRKLLEDAFPGLVYVWLRRRDKLRQGVSYAKALQTRKWWDADRPPAPFDRPRPDALRFDRVLLERSVTQMHLEELRWESYFTANGIRPFDLIYEDWVGDPDGAVHRVLDYLGLESKPSTSLPPSRFRRQADGTNDRWIDRLVTLSVNEPAIKWARAHEPEPGSTTAVPASLESALSNRRWWRVAAPFSHIRADDVFTPEVYAALEDQYRVWRAGGRFTRNIPGYDVTAMTVGPDGAGPFSVFCTREWHDALAGLFAVDATGEINVTLHHHARGSHSGSPHNDLNPAFFTEGARRADGILVSDPKRCNYRTGAAPGGAEVIDRVRAVAVIFYFGPDTGPAGGETGLYKAITDPVASPAVAVRPRGNSLVAFECTPFSFHAFMSNPQTERDTLVMWLHRARAEVVRRWGEASIVPW